MLVFQAASLTPSAVLEDERLLVETIVDVTPADTDRILEGEDVTPCDSESCHHTHRKYGD